MLNKKNRWQINHAFSLIELAIVLVVVGLLVAGITGGVSVVRSSSLRSVIMEYEQYKKAVNGFKTQYGQLPGDYQNIIGNSLAGNNNGVIEFINDADSNAAEGLIAWQHLQASGMIDAIFTPSIETVTIADKKLPPQTPQGGLSATIPASRQKKAGWIFDKFNQDDSVKTVLVLTAAIPETVNINSGVYKALEPVAVITPTDALAIDSKIDDGAAGSGLVRANDKIAQPKNCHDGAGYATNHNNLNCALNFQIN